MTPADRTPPGSTVDLGRPAALHAFAERQADAEAAERTNAQLYIGDRCDALGVPRPRRRSNWRVGVPSARRDRRWHASRTRHCRRYVARGRHDQRERPLRCLTTPASQRTSPIAHGDSGHTHGDLHLAEQAVCRQWCRCRSVLALDGACVVRRPSSPRGGTRWRRRWLPRSSHRRRRRRRRHPPDGVRDV